MILVAKETPDHLLLEIRQDILMENSKEFLDELESLLKKHPETKLLSMDFKSVQFMDSSGIGTLIRFTTTHQKNDWEFSIFGLNKNLMAVFQLSGIGNIIKLYTTNEFFKTYPDMDPSKVWKPK